MYVEDFPNCCTIEILYGFGGTEVAEDNHYRYNRAPSPEDLAKELLRKCRGAKGRGMGMCVATTNNEQKAANQALRLAGFKSSKWCSKTQHPETRIKLWYKCLEDV